MRPADKRLEGGQLYLCCARRLVSCRYAVEVASADDEIARSSLPAPIVLSRLCVAHPAQQGFVASSLTEHA